MKPQLLQLSTSEYIGKMFVLVFLYIVSGKIGLLLTLPPNHTPAIWPPAGIAIGMLLIYGRHFWPGILIGSTILGSYTLGIFHSGGELDTLKILAALGMAMGTTLQAFIGYEIVQRRIGFPLALNYISDIIKLFFLCGPIACVIAATTGTAILYISGFLPAGNALAEWLSIWLSNIFGVVVFLPLVLISPGSHRRIAWRGNALPGLPIAAALAVILSLGLTFYASKTFTAKFYRENLQGLEIFTSQSAARFRFIPLDNAMLDGILIAMLLAMTIRAILVARVKSAHLDASSKFNENIISAAPYIIIATDAEGTVTLFNEAAEKSLGYLAKDIIGKQPFDLWHYSSEVSRHAAELSNELQTEIRPGFDTFTAKAKITGRETKEWTFIRKDGSFFAGNLTITPLRDPRNKINGYLAVIEDISARKQVENSLRISEERNRLLVNGIEDYAIYWLDIHGYVNSWNSGAKNLHGYSAEEIIGEHFSAFFTQEDRTAGHPQAALREAIIKGKFTTEGWRVRKDGERFWAHIILEPIRDTNSEIIGFVEISRDETERQRHQRILETSEETFRSAMQSAAIGMALIDPSGRWLKVNPALCELLGYSEELLLANDFQSITHPDDLPEDIKHIDKALSGEINQFQLEKRYFHKSGRVISALLITSLVRDGAGKPQYFISQIQDITEQKEIERIKSEFISIVSHELRTPLTSIRGSLGLIVGTMKSTLPAPVAHLIEIAHQNSERLILLVNDILDIDKIASGQMRFDIKDEALAPLIFQAIDANQAYAVKLGVMLVANDLDESMRIQIDAARFIQILSNLLSNAAKFSRTGDLVEVYVTKSQNKIRISVVDHGNGIAEEFRPRIFGKFSQADSSATRSKAGTGLGLHITKQLVEQMNGEIGFDTELGKGTTFWIEFPA